MACVTREQHVDCIEDCPTCCPDHDWTAFENAIDAMRRPVLTEVEGVAWCLVHDGLAQDDRCRVSREGRSSAACHLAPLFREER